MCWLGRGGLAIGAMLCSAELAAKVAAPGRSQPKRVMRHAAALYLRDVH